METKPGTNRAGYFRKKPIDIFSGWSMCVNQFMYGNHFENICSALKFAVTPNPPFRYKCYEVQHNIVAWNGHMQKLFVPYWISRLDD